LTPPRTVIGSLVRVRLFGSPWTLRAIFAALLLIFAVLAFYPERYRAAVSLAPSDPSTLGLSGTLSQLGAINSVFGNQAAIEVALKVARSVYVRETAAKELHLQQRMHFDDEIEMYRWLDKEVKIRTLRGGIIQFEIYLTDGALGRDIVGAYADATQAQLARISQRQTEYKRDVLVKLVTEASERLGRARSAYDAFRLSSRAPIPEVSFQYVAERIASLEAAINAKDVEIAAARQFGTDENFQVRQLLTQRQSLQRQLAEVQATNPMENSSVGGAVAASARGEQLRRELSIAQLLYENYRRFLEGTSVEDMTSTANVRILEPPFIDTERQINYSFLAAALGVLLLWAAIEFYRWSPPVGERLIVRESHA